MIGIDTNVIVRFLTTDDAVQSTRVRKRLMAIAERGEKACISKIVTLETIWVLSSAYACDALSILKSLQKFYQLAMIKAEDPALIDRILALHQSKGPNLADQLILADYIFQGCETVITFDKKAKQLKGFTAV